MSELPESWAQAPLAAITREVTQRVPSDDETIRYIDIGSVNRTTKEIEPPQKLLGKDAPSRARKQVAAGDTLVSMTRPNLNAVALVPKELDGEIASTGFDVLRPVDGIDPRWISYLVRTEEFVTSMSALVQGALYPAVRSKDVRAHAVPLAPAEEQIRIANQLDTLLTRIQSCNDRFGAISALIKRFRLAVCAAATTGPWEPSTIRAISVDLRYGTSKKCDYIPTGTGVLRIPNIAEQGRIDVTDLKRAEFDANELQKLALMEGDLLVIRSNGSVELVGKTGLVTEKESGLLFAGYLMRLRVDRTMAIPAFIQLCLSAPLQREYIERTAKSTSGVNNINAEELRSLPLLLPPLSEQIEIVRRAKALLALADRIEARANAARTPAQRLSPLVLAKAFRGELVQQDPQDEPASALLERIASQRTAPTVKKQSKTPRQVRASRAPKEAAAVTKSRQDENIKGKPYLADHLRRLGSPTTAEVLFRASELPIADFYKQLAWEVAQGHIADGGTTLEARYEAG